MTESDTRAFTLAAILILGASVTRYGVELRNGRQALAWDTASALPELIEVSRARLEEDEKRRRPLSPDERVDPNTATEADLDRLPGLGPGAARAVVADREANGPFRAADDLLRVRGVGPKTLEKMRPHLDLPEDPGSGRSAEPRYARTPRSRDPSVGAVAAPTGQRLDLNRADTLSLQSLSGVGPALARRIVELRSRLGRFTSIDQLTEVRGIGPATLDRLRPHVRVR